MRAVTVALLLSWLIAALSKADSPPPQAVQPPPCAVPGGGHTLLDDFEWGPGFIETDFKPENQPDGDSSVTWAWAWRVGLGHSNWFQQGGLRTSGTVCENQPLSCWRIGAGAPDQVLQATRPKFGDSRGFPLNLDIYSLPSTTNFAPLSQDAVRSTAPFVSVPGDAPHRPLFLMDRKRVAGVVDPITGQPLIREVDLELPVGQATYRMIRTYGGNADGGCHRNAEGGVLGQVGLGGRPALGQMWDWAGVGWMMSENPVLLFDAKYVQHEPSLPRRCWLILDAHHSIPFTQDLVNGTYAAPAWFDAILTLYDGESPLDLSTAWNFDSSRPELSTWEDGQRPTHVRVSLHQTSVTYTFRIVYGETTPEAVLAPMSQGPEGVTAHDAPLITRSVDALTVVPPSTDPNGPRSGLGTPYLALLERIEDRFGNRAEITHSTPKKKAAVTIGDCALCKQTCTEQGQIRTVKLYRKGDAGDVLEWTLLYVHRSFRLWSPEAVQAHQCGNQPVSSHDEHSHLFMQNAVHAVYVYKGQPTGLPDAGADTTLPAELFVGVASPWNDSLDALDADGWTELQVSTLGWEIPPGWTFRLRYTYDEPLRQIDECEEGNPNPTGNKLTAFANGSVPGIFKWGTPLEVEEVVDNAPVLIRYNRVTPTLLRVEKTDRSFRTDDANDEVVSYTGYLYQSHLDQPLTLLKGGAGSSDAVQALVFETAEIPRPDWTHLNPHVMPKLKHILRDDRLRAAARATGGTSINSVFSPALWSRPSGEPVPRNTLNYAEFANLTLDWMPVDYGVQLSPQDADRHDLLAKPCGPLLNDLLNESVLNQVDKSRLVLRNASMAMVTRVRVNEPDAPDDTFDLIYFSVSPRAVVRPEMAGIPKESSADCLDGAVVDPSLNSGWLDGHSADNVIGLSDTYTLFPFTRRRLAIASFNSAIPGAGGFASASVDYLRGGEARSAQNLDQLDLAEPTFITLVDRHRGESIPGSGNTTAPYMLRWMLTLTEASGMHVDGKPMRPRQREVVGLNAAGFVLFGRQWDYENNGFEAEGPTEEFIYEPYHETVVVGTDDTTGAPISAERLIGLHLVEHRSLGWGVALLEELAGGSSPAVAATSGLAATRGLIRLFDYHSYTPQTQATPVETNLISEVSVQEGTEGTPKRLQQNVYEAHTDQLVRQARFVLDAGGQAVEHGGTAWHFSYHDDKKEKVKRILTYGDAAEFPAPSGSGSPVSLHPFEAQFFSADGRLIGRAYGLHPAPQADAGGDGGAIPTVEGATVFVDVYGYDELGRRVLEIVDAEQPERPASWEAFDNRLPNQGQIEGAFNEVAVLVSRQVPNDVAHLLPPLNRISGAAFHPLAGRLEVAAKPGDRFDLFPVIDVRLQSSTDSQIDAYSSAQVALAYYDVSVEAPDTPDYPYSISSGRAGTIATILGGEVRRTWSVAWQPMNLVAGVPDVALPAWQAKHFDPPLPDQPGTSTLSASDIESASYRVLAEVRPGYDNAGRTTNVKARGFDDEEPDTEELERDAVYTDFGLVGRRIEPSGTLRRMVYSPLGQLLAEYMGTRDGGSSCWQTVHGASGEDNTVLTARHFYGLGINNIRQPVLTRRYRTEVKCDDTDFHGQGDSDTKLSDRAGWEEAYGYDRRGRRSVAEHYGATLDSSDGVAVGNAREPASINPEHGTFGEAAVSGSWSTATPPLLLRAEYTWYDHQDRVRFTATFGPHAAKALRDQIGDSSINPRVRDVYTLGDPSAQDILAAGPLELRENVYNARGELAEQRNYSVSTAPGDAGYESTRMYYDHAGRVLVRISSSGHWERSTYDALGRLVATSTMRGAPAGTLTGTDYELERRDYAYHENGQPERTSVVTRVLDEDPALTAGPGGNAVRTDQVTWYDDSARVIATASFGTNSAADEYANDTSTPPLAPTQGPTDRPPPTFNDSTGQWMLDGVPAPSWVQFSTRAYDDAGRVIEETDHLGTVTKTDYDGLGRVIRTRVAPFGQSGSTVTTRYRYEQGRLRFIGAERPGSPHALDNKPGLSEAEWKQASKFLQVTELVYNKYEQNNPTPRPDWVVIDPATPDEPPISDNYDWPAGVRLPRGFCLADFNNNGNVAIDDIFNFLSAWFGNLPGSDANGDGVRNVTDIFFFLSQWFAGSGGCGHRYQFGEELDIKFRYTIDGLLAERIERVNVNESNRLRYTYDTLGRRTGIVAETVDQSGNPIQPLPTAPVGMLAEATYRFDPLDRLVEATAYAAPGAGPSNPFVIAQNRFNYDGWGRLLSEEVAHGETLQSAATGARTLSYAWSGPAAPGSDPSNGLVVRRLDSMTLPWQAPTTTSPIAIGYDYGQADPTSTDHLLSRVRSIWLGVPGSTSQAIAAFEYIGGSTRSSLLLGLDPVSEEFAVEQRLAPSLIGSGTDARPTVSGLDRFGRPTHLRYDGPPASMSGPRTRLWEARMAYDTAGRRVMDRIWLGAPETGQTEALGSDRSWAYGYDTLGRLTGAVSGRIHDPSATTLDLRFGSGNVDRRLRLAWNLDELGNIRQSEPPPGGTGEPPDFGRVRTLFEVLPNAMGVIANRPVEVVSSGHVVNTRNQMEALDFAKKEPYYGPADPGDPGYSEPEPTIRTTLPIVYDAPGRLRFDGSRVLDYDALGRLVRIRAAGGLQAAAFGTPQAPAEPAAAGRLVAAYHYDALGRLFRAQRPEAAEANLPPTLRVTDIYHDGVRSVQEVVGRGVPAREVAATQTTPAIYLEAAPWTRPTSLKAHTNAPPGSAWALERTYIHAADPGARADDILCQMVYLDGEGLPSPNPVTLYTLSDVNGNVVALADRLGRLAAQYSYEPDGRLRSAEIPSAPATGPPVQGEWEAVIAAARSSRLGFQGLWAERVDVEGATTSDPTAGLDPLGVGDADEWPGAPSGAGGLQGGAVAATHEVVYFARNRFYSPGLNRWTAADPNAMGVPVLGSLWWGGGAPTPPAATFDLRGHYGDGMSAHAAYGGRPLSATDPLGLFIDDPEDLLELSGAYSTVNEALEGVKFVLGFMQRLEQYGLNQTVGAFWATDWSSPDDLDLTNRAFAGFSYKTPFGGGDAGASGPAMASSAFPGQTPTLPLTLRAGRHGGDWHDGRINAIAHYWETSNVFNVRKNQDLILPDGSRIRPDLIVKDKQGQYRVYEVMDTSSMTKEQLDRRRDKIALALGVPPGQVKIHDIRRNGRSIYSPGHPYDPDVPGSSSPGKRKRRR